MNTISMAINNRPFYLERVLRSLEEAEGHERWTIVFSSEGSSSIVNTLAKSVRFMPFYYSQNAVQMGCDVNTFLAAEIAHRIGSEFNLHLEDDIIISKDTLLMAEDFIKHSRVYDVLALRRLHEDPGQPAHLAHSHDGLLGCGFGFFPGSWHEHLRSWWLFYEHGMPGHGWDLALPWMMDRYGYRQWRPMINRSQSIGVKGGCHGDNNDPNMTGPCFQGLERTFTYG